MLQERLPRLVPAPPPPPPASPAGGVPAVIDLRLTALREARPHSLPSPPHHPTHPVLQRGKADQMRRTRSSSVRGLTLPIDSEARAHPKRAGRSAPLAQLSALRRAASGRWDLELHTYWLSIACLPFRPNCLPHYSAAAACTCRPATPCGTGRVHQQAHQPAWASARPAGPARLHAAALR